MADRIFKPKPGEEIVITVARGKKQASPMGGGARRRKGIVSVRQPDEFLPRRLQKGLIQLYDLGAELVGDVWRTKNFAIEPTVTNPATDPDIREVLQEDFEIRDAVFFADDVILHEGKRIEKTDGAFYKIQISGDGFVYRSDDPTDAAFTTGGVKLTSAELNADNFRIAQRLLLPFVGMESDVEIYFQPITLTGNSKNHITGVYDPDAAPVAFTPRSNDKYYLLPSLYRASGDSFRPDGNGITAGFVFCFVPRIFSETDSLLDRVYFNYFIKPSASETDFEAAATRLISIPGVKGYRRTGPDAFIEYDLTEFPASYTESGAEIKYEIEYPVEGLNVLAAIVKQDNNLFYVWT